MRLEIRPHAVLTLLVLCSSSTLATAPQSTQSGQVPIPKLSPDRQALALQADCASDAMQYLTRRGWKPEDGETLSDFQSHFSTKLKKCFVLVSNYMPKDDVRLIDVYDIEGNHYASYHGHNSCGPAGAGKSDKCAIDSGALWYDGDDSRMPPDFVVGFHGLLYGSGRGNQDTQRTFIQKVRAAFMTQ